MNHALKRGDLLLEQRRWKAALEEFGKCLAAEPENVEAHIGAAWALEGLDSLPKAEEHARSAIAADPNDAYSHYVLSFMLYRRWCNQEALVALDAGLELAPWRTPFHGLRAHILCQSGRWTAAWEAAQVGLRIYPECSDCLSAGARALVGLGLPLMGENAFRQGLCLKPEDPFLQAGAGRAALAAQDRDGALLYFVEALRLNPELKWVRGELERMRAKEQEREREEAEAVHRENPEDMNGLLSLAKVLVRQGIPLTAYNLLRRGLSKDPENPMLHVGAGLATLACGNRDEALRYLDEALRLNPELELERAREEWQRIDDLEWLRGELERLRAKEWERAEAANRKNPEDFACPLAMAQALVRQGQPLTACDILRQGLSREPENPLLHLGACLAALVCRNRDEALLHFGEALRLKPELERLSKKWERLDGLDWERMRDGIMDVWSEMRTL